MARIFVSEFEEGQEITSAQFNKLNSDLSSFRVNSENLSNEAINSNLVKNNTVFSGNKLFTFSSVNVNGEKKNDYRTWLADNENWIKRNFITLENIKGGDKILVRSSCRITLPDYGFKTFFSGKNPIIQMMLRFRLNTSDSDGDDNWVNVPETLQEFTMAFGGKIPSDSSLSSITCETVGGVVGTGDATVSLKDFYNSRHSSRGLNESRTNTRVTAGTSGEHRDTTDPSTSSADRYDLSYRDSQPFAMSVDYTIAHVISPLVDQTNVQFAVWGGHTGWEAAGGDLDAGGAKGNGCKKPEFLGFSVSDFNLYGYKIQK